MFSDPPQMKRPSSSFESRTYSPSFWKWRFGALIREEVSQTLNDPSPADVDDELRHHFAVMGS